MNKTMLPDKQIQILRENPHVYFVLCCSIFFAKEFKEIFHKARFAGKLLREIFAEQGFDLSILGEYRIKNIAYGIPKEYQKYG